MGVDGHMEVWGLVVNRGPGFGCFQNCPMAPGPMPPHPSPAGTRPSLLPFADDIPTLPVTAAMDPASRAGERRGLARPRCAPSSSVRWDKGVRYLTVPWGLGLHFPLLLPVCLSRTGLGLGGGGL